MQIPKLGKFTPCDMWNSIFDVPMDSESTARVVDSVDLGSFRGDKVFTPTNGAVLAALATMAYSNPVDQRAHLRKQEGLVSYHFLDSQNNVGEPDTGTQVSLVETRDALLVAARGTTPPLLSKDPQWQDYFHDMAALPVPNDAGDASIHGGFKRAADGIWRQLKPYLEQARAANKAVHFAGHSLGAAIALQLADRAATEMDLLAGSVVRTGGPDLGWGDEDKHLQANGLAARTVNFINNTDPIPLALPGGVTSGHQVYFDRNGRAALEKGVHWWNRGLGSLKGLMKGNINPLYDHVPVFYNEKIQDPKNAAVLAELERLIGGR
ncbi:MAG: hypothetical protein KF760_34730 [Candidatus Eremiobacteraeota bacterium]|nr:hypothetical protein [Candidatus Eremiobacteraeota bacterium]MCW5868421.1 hypothetical protein [Candidatus Eremiobacteraeota bacterium]